MLQNFYLVLLLIIPSSICFDYGTVQDGTFQPNINKKVRGRRKYNHEEENLQRSSSNVEVDDKNPMTQLDLMSFITRPDDNPYADNTPDVNQMSYSYDKYKRGILPERFHFKRTYVKKIPKNPVQLGDEINTKLHENVNSFNFDENIAYDLNNNNVDSHSDFSYKGIIKSDKNENLQQNGFHFFRNAAIDSINDDENLRTSQNANMKRRKLNCKRVRMPTTDQNTASGLVYKGDDAKQNKDSISKRYDMKNMVYNENAPRRNDPTKLIESVSGSEVVYGDEIKKTSQYDAKNYRGPENKKLTKRFKIPFFSRRKSDAKRIKKRKLFCGCNKNKQTVIIETTSKPSSTKAQNRHIKMLKRSYEERLCPLCRKKFVSKPIIHNSRQYFKIVSKIDEPLKEYNENAMNNDESFTKDTTQTLNQEDEEEISKDEPGDSQDTRDKREHSMIDRARQLKELEEVERKINNVEIKGSAVYIKPLL